MLATIAPTPVKNAGKTSILGMNSVNMQSSQKQQDQNSQLNNKKFTYTNMSFGQQPISVVRRNARERNRVKQVNNGFVTLRQHIPQNIIQALSNGGRGPHKKLSKVDTLRLAVEYIRRLQDLVTDVDLDKSSLTSTSIISDFSNSTFDQMLSSPPNSETSSYYTASPEPITTHLHHSQSTYPNSAQILLHNSSFESQTHNHSEASISPAPSYISDTSSLSPSSMPNYGYGLNNSTNSTTTGTTTSTLAPLNTTSSTIAIAAATTNINYSVNQFKFEPYDDYSSIHHPHHHPHHQQHHQHNVQHHHQHHHPNNNSIIVETSTTSEDEELLDYISMWQEEQQ